MVPAWKCCNSSLSDGYLARTHQSANKHSSVTLPWCSQYLRSFRPIRNTCRRDYNSVHKKPSAIHTCVRVINNNISWTFNGLLSKQVIIRRNHSSHGIEEDTDKGMKTNKSYTVPRIASKSGLFLLVVLLREAKVSKELGINLESYIVQSQPTPFMLRARWRWGLLIPFLWFLILWLRAVWCFCFTILNNH